MPKQPQTELRISPVPDYRQFREARQRLDLLAYQDLLIALGFNQAGAVAMNVAMLKK